MEESGSENLDEELAKRKDTFLRVCLSIIILFHLLFQVLALLVSTFFERMLIMSAFRITIGSERTNPV